MSETLDREKQLIQEIEAVLPEFAEECKNEDADFVLIHQDAFAGAYQPEEFTLLGKAIKYAGLLGKEVRIITRKPS